MIMPLFRPVVIASSLSVLVAGDVIPNYSYEAAVAANRHLQDACGGTIGDLVSCQAAECASEPCELQDGSVEVQPPATLGGWSCEVLEQTFCESLDSACCPPCAEITQQYLDCIVENSFLQLFCPGASCKAFEEEQLESGNVTMALPDSSNTTTANVTTMEDMIEEEEEEDSEPIEDIPDEDMPEEEMPEEETPEEEETPDEPDAGDEDEIDDTDVIANAFGDEPEGDTQEDDDWLSGPCAIEIATVFACYLKDCSAENCEQNLDEVLYITLPEDGGVVEDCNAYTDGFCTSIATASKCCDACAEANAAYSACVIESKISKACPEATCGDEVLVETSKSGTQSRANLGGTEQTSNQRPNPNKPQESAGGSNQAMQPIDNFRDQDEFESSSGPQRTAATLVVVAFGLLSLLL